MNITQVAKEFVNLFWKNTQGKETIARELIDLCKQAPQQIDSLLPEEIRIQLSSMRALEEYGESMGQLPKRIKISALITTKDLRKLTQLYLQTCSKEALLSLLGLDAWQTTGNKQDACQRIINCFVSSGLILNLKELQLSSLPNAIGQLSNLQRFDCSYNHLTSLPEAIDQLSNLHWFNCSNNQLISLPEIIGQLSNLESLKCCNNRLTSLPEAIIQLVNLKFLDCSSNELTSLPETIGQLSDLQGLDFSHNRMNFLPQTIGQLSNLQSLDCSSNRLNFLPDTIGQLSKLAWFKCSHNQLNFLPDTIGQLSNLAWLSSCGNQLTSLPDTIGQLSNLAWLDCCYNRLTSLPDITGQLSNLHWFNCSNNQITSLLETIGELSNMQRLDCSYNPLLASLPLDVFNLSSSCTIEITNTGLSESVLQRIRERISNSNYTGPNISYNIRQNVSEEPKSLNELLNTLYADLGSQVPKQLNILSENPEQAQSFCSWLQRLSWTADGQNIEESKKAFYIAITDIIEFAAVQNDYRTLFHTILLDASRTCGDRITLSIIQLEIAKQEITIDKTNLPVLADFLKRGYLAMQMLEEIAKEKTLSLRFFDEVEVYLAYPIKLKDDLDLPFSAEKMLFMPCSGVTDKDLKLAKEQVQTKLNDQNAVVNFLIKNSTWIEALKGQFPETVKTIQHATIEKGEDPAEAYRTLTFEAISRKRKASD